MLGWGVRIFGGTVRSVVTPGAVRSGAISEYLSMKVARKAFKKEYIFV